MLKITKENISVSFSSDLRDIFGFDETNNEGIKVFFLKRSNLSFTSNTILLHLF